MSFDYLKTKGTADRLINNFGASLAFSRETGETFDPTTGQTTATTQSFNRDVVWAEYRNQEIDGTTVQQGDARLIISGEVKIGDRVTKNGTEWRILDVSPLQPADLAIIHIAQARQ